VQGLLELVDQRGAFPDERNLVAAQDAQFGHQRILRGQRPPRVAVDA